MNYFNHQNVQLAYEAVYNQDLCESMEDLGLIDDYDYLTEAQGSYGQTPKATSAYRNLAARRRQTPAAEFKGKKGGKKGAVERAEMHAMTSTDVHARRRGKKLNIPTGSSHRKNMTPEDREYHRTVSHWGEPLDSEEPGPSMGPGGIPKGKKLARQRKTGVSAESYNLYDALLEYLLDEGYADTLGSAEIILENMSDEWIDEILLEKAERSPLPIKKMKKKEQKLLDKQERLLAPALRTPIGSPERAAALRAGERFSNIHGTRRSISTRGGKRPLEMPDVGRFRSSYT